MIHIARKYTHFVFTTFLIIMFFVVYFGAMNYLQMRIESQQSVPEGMMSREDAIERATDFVYSAGFIPQDHQVWIRDAISMQDVVAVDYFSQKQYDLQQHSIFPWRRIFGMQDLGGDLRQADLWHWSIQIADKSQRDGGFTVDVSSGSGHIVNFSRYGWDSQRSHFEEISEEEKKIIAFNFLRFTNDTQYTEQFSLSIDDMTKKEHCSLWQRIGTTENEIFLQRKSMVWVCGGRIESYRSNFVTVNEDDFLLLTGSMFRIVFLGLLPIVAVFFSSIFLSLGVVIFLFIRKLKKRPIILEWQKTFFFGWVLFLMLLVKNIFDHVGVLSYNHNFMGFEINFNEIMRICSNVFEDTVFGGAIAFVLPPVILLAVGRYLSLKFFSRSFHAFDLLFSGKWESNDVFKAIVRGFITLIALLIIQCLMIVFGGFFANAWSDVRNPLNAITYGFHFFSSTLAYNGFLLPALTEEITFRVFCIAVLFLRYKNSVLAIVLASVLWSFSHVTLIYHPFYFQQLTLILNGILLGWVFIRYGLLEVIVAHFFFNTLAFLIPVFAIATVAESISLALVSMLPILLPLCVYCFHIFSRQYKQKRTIIGST